MRKIMRKPMHLKLLIFVILIASVLVQILPGQNAQEVLTNAKIIELVKMRLEAARLARDYAQKQLDGEDKRFQAGLGTTFLILQRQTELAQAKGAELRALTDYNKLVAQLQRDIATTLTNYNIEVKSDANPDGDKK